MKKFFKKTVKFLFDTALITIMMVSAQHAMNLPLGWACFGCVAIFGAALTVWTNTRQYKNIILNNYVESV